MVCLPAMGSVIETADMAGQQDPESHDSARTT